MPTHHKKDKKHGLTVSHHQHVDIPEMKHETVVIPSTSAPSFGSYFIFDCKEKGVLLHNLAIQVNMSAIGGYTNSSPYPHYAPLCFLFNRIEIVLNNTVIDTWYPLNNFVHVNLFNPDEKRRMINNQMGPYDNQTTRYTLSSSANTYYISLETLFKQSHPVLIYPKDDLQLRVYTNNITDIVVPGGLSGTPTSTINYANLLCTVSRLQSSHVQNYHNTLTRSALHYKYLECRYGIFSVPTPTSLSQVSIVLTPFVGSITHLFFVVRYSTTNGTTTVPNNQDGFYQFNAITNFAILDNTSTNIVGGVSIASQESLTLLNSRWIQSSYTSETSPFGITNNNSNVYLYSFTADPSESHKNGVAYGSHRFFGNEQLQITFNSSTAYSAAEIQVYALAEAALEVTSTYCKKISL